MALYRHFDSMGHVTAAVWNACFAELNERVWGDWDETTGRGSDDRDRPGQIAHCFRQFTRYAQSYPQRFWFMFSAPLNPEDFGMQNLGMAGYEYMVALIRTGVAAGDFHPDTDPARATMKLGQRLLGFSCQVAPTATNAIIGFNPKDLLDEAIHDVLSWLRGQELPARSRVPAGLEVDTA